MTNIIESLEEFLLRRVKKLAKENTEMRDILQDFLATKECRETWIAEMRGTIDDVLNRE